MCRTCLERCAVPQRAVAYSVRRTALHSTGNSTAEGCERSQCDSNDHLHNKTHTAHTKQHSSTSSGELTGTQRQTATLNALHMSSERRHAHSQDCKWLYACVHLPSTIPPFTTTKPANSAAHSRYAQLNCSTAARLRSNDSANCNSAAGTAYRATRTRIAQAAAYPSAAKIYTVSSVV